MFNLGWTPVSSHWWGGLELRLSIRLYAAPILEPITAAPRVPQGSTIQVLLTNSDLTTVYE